MEILKIVFVAVVGAMLYLYLKSQNSELSGLTVVATGIIIILLSVSYVISAMAFFSEMATKTGINSEVFVLIIKIVAISYLADFSSSLCDDLGVKSLGEKVNFVSRIIIFVLSIPVFNNLLNLVSSFVL